MVTLILLLAGEKPVHARQTNSEKEIFMWVGAQKLQEQQPATLENMLLFARRFDIIPILPASPSLMKLLSGRLSDPR
ncbi:MAG TPA: hypothetical protein VJ876_06700 [Bacteroidales bacterium]|nr:hypothetical protein [Bacteroidales bacterium]